MQVVVGQVQVLQWTIVYNDIKELVHLVAPHAVPTDVKLLERARTLNKMHQFLEVRLIQVCVNKA